MRIVEYQVEPAADGATVERFLRRRGVSRRVLIDLKNDPDGLTVGGAHIRAIDRLHAGDTLRLSLRETERSDTIPQAALPLPIVYEDEDLFVIDKPRAWRCIRRRKTGKIRWRTRLPSAMPRLGNRLCSAPSGGWIKTPRGCL